jgi:hypothetical protein
VAARYTALPVLLIEAALIIGADHALRGRRALRMRHAIGRRRPVRPPRLLRPTLAVAVLAAFLIGNWWPTSGTTASAAGPPPTTGLRWRPSGGATAESPARGKSPR